MFESLGWLPTFPLLGFLTLFLSGGGLPKKLVAVIGAGSIGLAFCAAVLVSLPINCVVWLIYLCIVYRDFLF